MSEPEYEFPVDRTAILTFAAAIGETNPIYWNASHAKSTPLGDVIAPPTFGVSSAHWNPSYGLRGTRKIPPRVEAQPSETKPRSGGGGGSLARVLHGEQRFAYHKPLQPGMKLRVATRAGKAWEKEGKKGGKLEFTETITEYRDESGDLVLVATSVGVLTEKAVEQ
jgi:acyl dehydratase